MKKQQPIHINLAPKLQEKVSKLEREILELQNSIWRHKRNEQRYKRALFEILGVQSEIVQESPQEAAKRHMELSRVLDENGDR